MKRLVLSLLTTACGVLLALPAHASYAERLLDDHPRWNTLEQTESTPADAADLLRQEQEKHFNDTDTGAVEFGATLRTLPALRLNGTGPITRGAFTALLVRSLYDEGSISSCYWDITSVVPPHFSLLFRDVSIDHPYAPEICVAMRDGLVRGYGNDIFRPEDEITFTDAAKIIARAHGLTPWADPSKPKHWFDVYVSALARRNAIPLSIETLEDHLTVDEARTILTRLAENDRSQASRTADALIAAWEKTYEAPKRAVVVPRLPVASPSVRSSSSSSIGTLRSLPRTSSAGSRTSSTASVRQKAWYEF